MTARVAPGDDGFASELRADEASIPVGTGVYPAFRFSSALRSIWMAAA